MKNTTSNLFIMMHNFFWIYLVSYRSASKNTIRSYKQAINQFRLYLQKRYDISFTAMDFSYFSRDHVYGFLVYLRDEKKLAVSTLNQRLAAIKAFLKYSGDEDISVINYYTAVTKIHKFKGEKSPKVEYLSQPQLKVLFSIPDISTRMGRRDRFMMILLYESGARIDEFLNIKIEDIIKGETTQLRLFGKGRKERYIPLFGTVVEHLNEYLSEFHKLPLGSDYLFYTVHDNKHTMMSAENVDYLLKKYAKIAVETDATFPVDLHAHVLRHSIAMAMYKKGVPLSYIKDFLGHSDISSTSIYAYADSDTIAEAIASIEHEPANNKTNTKNWKGKEADLLAFCGLTE
ncbi:tyrosine-type recombinase/integrase [Butyrivibrio sp. INlla16]|uniref:tyrosine-type recombinase/integrase n=1 Tax=Butyrivibrio sp. INlla16 TaxID=1520807 RepID=UPI00087F261B|nr:tyrosine-type recombinase/integrase [Butyrivibrio sp. INlla16]SDB54323.1 Site-specific recombinase XerD [Butyrivibrio sp. INlla16]